MRHETKDFETEDCEKCKTNMNQALKPPTPSTWYDYDKQERIAQIPVNTRCYVQDVDLKWYDCQVLGYDDAIPLVKVPDWDNQYVCDEAYMFRPLDWDKNEARDEWIKQSTDVIGIKNRVTIEAMEKLYDALLNGNLKTHSK